MANKLYDNDKEKIVKLVVDSFKLYGVMLTYNQAYISYKNYLKENFNVDWADDIKYSSPQMIVSKLKYFIPKNKLRFLR